MKKMIEAMEQEVANLVARRTMAIEHAIRLLQADATSSHLGHNLGNRANEISEINAKLEQTVMILADMRARVALEGGK